MMTQAAFSKMRRTHEKTMYPQPEGNLGEALLNYGKELGYDSGLGKVLQTFTHTTSLTNYHVQ